MLIALAALAAMTVFASKEVDPASAAESGYLAGLATAVLLAAGALAPRPSLEVGLGAVLATGAVWALPAGPARGGAVVLVLATTLGVAAIRRLSRTLPDLPFEVAVPLALGCQVLLRGDLLFTPELTPRTLVALVALPVAGGVAATVLSWRFGGLPALVAAGTVLTLGPGWNVAATLGLVALAAGSLLARRELGWMVRAAALAALLAPVAWDPWTGTVTAIAGLALAFPNLAIALGAVFLVAKLALLAFWPSAVPNTSDGLAWPLFLVPTLLLVDRSRLGLAVLAAVLGASVPHVPDVSALAAPVGLAVLLLSPQGLVLQRAWTGILLAGAVLFASYPWLRERSLVEQAVEGPGFRGIFLAVALPVLFFLIGMGFERWAARRPESRLRPDAVIAGLAFAFLMPFLLAPGTPLIPRGTVVLNAARPVWETVVPPGPVRAVVLDSSLSNSAPVAPETTVATVRLVGRGGGEGTAWPLRIGRETGEWAALRADVRRWALSPPPEPWVSWVAGDFLGQRYRSRLDLQQPERPSRLRIERTPGLPPDVEIALHGVEVRP